MNNEFDKVYNRKNTDSIKWNRFNEEPINNDCLPMWVADADWPTATPVFEKIIERAKQGIFGYPFIDNELNEIIVSWLKKHYDWQIKPEWIVFTEGVVPSINVSIKGLTKRGDRILLQSPVYHPFFSAIENNECYVVNNQLKITSGKYRMDFKQLKELFNADSESDSGPIKLMILCNPHNPVGRVWTKDELQQLGEICLNNDVKIISDEIHADFIFSNNKHQPIAALNEKFAHNTITLMSPSKTFNIAGLNPGYAIIPDEELRSTFKKFKAGFVGSGNIFGLTAMKWAYLEGGEWLKKQIKYIEKNIEHAYNFINDKIPQISTIKPEGTYLLWINFKKTGLNSDEINELLLNEAKIILNQGRWFGPGGEYYMRMNVACPGEILEKGLHRIKRTIEDLY